MQKIELAAAQIGAPRAGGIEANGKIIRRSLDLLHLSQRLLFPGWLVDLVQICNCLFLLRRRRAVDPQIGKYFFSCAHVLPSHRSSLQWRTFVPAVKTALAWPHAHSTVSCRSYDLLLSLSCPGGALRNRRVLRDIQFTECFRPQVALRRLRDDFAFLFIIIYDSSPLFKQILAKMSAKLS